MKKSEDLKYSDIPQPKDELVEVRIYPRVRFYDGEILEFALAKTFGKKKLVELDILLKNLVADYNDFKPQFVDVSIGGKKVHVRESYPRIDDIIENIKKEITKYLEPKRENWTEVRFEKFCEDFEYWFNYLFKFEEVKVNSKGGFIEGKVSQEFIDRYLLVYDHQIREGDKWVSGNKEGV